MANLQIDIVSDVVCPWCYIGKRHLEAALAAFREKRPEINILTRWHPFQLNPDLRLEGIDRRSYLEQKFGGPARAKEIYARVGAAGSAAGLALNFDAIQKQPNTLAAHALIGLAQGDASADTQLADRVVEALFRAYFIEGRFVGDMDVLVEIASNCGMDAAQVRSHLNDASALQQVASADAGVRSQGVTGVPFFVFNQKLAVSGAQPPEVIVDAMVKSLSRLQKGRFACEKNASYNASPHAAPLAHAH